MKELGKNSGLPITQLRRYSPPSGVWIGISEKLEAIETSEKESIDWPNYHPSPDVWKRVESELELRAKLGALPRYAPPSGLKIELVDRTTIPVNTYTRSFKFWTRIAAGIMMLAVSALVVTTLLEKQAKMEYRVEWTSEDETVNFFPAGISGNEMIAKLCENSIPLCNTAKFASLRTELERLETARGEVEAQMNKYGDNQDLERLLTQIELEHMEIIKQMSQAIYE